MEKLTGDRESAIYKNGEVVIRPLNPWSATVHRVLRHLVQSGVQGVPELIRVKGQQEHLSYVEGDIYDYPLVGEIATQEALKSAATFLRNIHDATASFLSENMDVSHTWMLKARQPQEVICHGDFAPYNVALSGNVVVGAFDFDTVHPAPRVWDLAYSIYCWAPFKTDKIDNLGSISDQILRAKVFCDSYGADSRQREKLPDVMIERLTALVDLMQYEAKQGNGKFAENIIQGHHLSYLKDIAYIQNYKEKIRHGLCR
ncbi:phosphotransferase [Grimontia hollisae]|uniref:Aminoglycoside phosphotransferase domain-containing protein n=1 Tax=Grimontia hollisae CIP 101886 TaxID=675812 RepID=D0IA85_GRIHO|nr:aminoglycoside phosphotransferase family protein [Grimontia hollisae]AMG31782.1 phosphotransferase [Grimontia hollisae]EEY70803.1 hypothetical protein VHA_002662 [Grimontia hollisae CIP 101886]STO44784.1 Phosphotransferase enzyme family [Grimontia hollisae]